MAKLEIMRSTSKARDDLINHSKSESTENTISENAISEKDSYQRFFFPELAAKGCIVRIQKTWQDLCFNRGYPLAIKHLVGELAVVNLMFASQLKHNGRVSMQIAAKQAFKLLLLDCNNQLDLRGMVILPDHPYPVNEQLPKNIDYSNMTQSLYHQLKEEGANLLLLLEQESSKNIYQSVVAINHDNPSTVISEYLYTSEQQDNFSLISCNETECAAFFLFKMPNNDDEIWQRMHHFASTLKGFELLKWSNAEILRKLFHHELEDNHQEIILSPQEKIRYHSPRDHDKIKNIVRSLGKAECYEIIKEKGNLVIHDDMGNHEYTFSLDEIDKIFAEHSPSD